jgi:hypothetical protein
MHIQYEKNKDGEIVTFDYDEYFEPLYKKPHPIKGSWIIAEVINFDTKEFEEVIFWADYIKYEQEALTTLELGKTN